MLPEPSQPALAPVLAPPQYPRPQRLSISTTSSSSSGAASFLSIPTPRSSVSSAGSARLFLPVPPPPPPPPSNGTVAGTASASAAATGASTRAYWCTSCGKKLARKFDWKRHEEEFHEKPRKYPCPDCDRVFHGANTFNQHHRVTHRCRTCPHSDRVVRPNTGRRRRAWGCGFCAAFCAGLERYQEHVALHFESGKTMAHWDHANVIYGLLHQPLVHDAWKRLQAARWGHLAPSRRPMLSWPPETTGRMHGFLDNETPGHLQDLLEFFDPHKHNADYVVRMADEQALRFAPALEAYGPAAAAAADDHDHAMDDDELPPLPGAPSARTSRSPPYRPLRASFDAGAAGYAERPLPRVQSQNFYPSPVEYHAPPAGATQDRVLDFLAAGPQHHHHHVLPDVEAGDMLADWNSLASTMVDDPTPFAMAAAAGDGQRGWDPPQFLGSVGTA